MPVADDIIAFFHARGHENYGEDVTQLEHALQCAQLAVRAGASETLVVAALLHDIGHLVADLAPDAAEHGIDDRHEVVGNRYLVAHFPPSVAEPVRLHVDAKRYLCAVRPGYHDALSAASKLSLGLQGGPMSAEEVKEFEANPFYQDAVILREWDDSGKDPSLTVAPIESYREAIASQVS